MKSKYFLSGILITSITLSCTALTYAESPDSTQEAFEKICSDFFDDIISEAPVNIHFLFSEPADKYLIQSDKPLGEFFSDEDFSEKYEADYSDVLDALSELDTSKLTIQQHQLYQNLKYNLELSLQTFTLPDYDAVLDPLTGVISNLNTEITEYYLLSEYDINTYISLLKDIPRFLDEALEALDYQADAGYPATLYAINSALESRSDMTCADTHPYLEAFKTNIKEAGLTEEEMNERINEVSEIISNEVVPSFDAFYDKLEEMAANAADGRGLCYYEQGDKYYELLAESYTGTKMSVDELYDYLTEKTDEAIDRIINSSYDGTDFSFPSEKPADIIEYLNDCRYEYMPDCDIDSCTISYLPKALEIDNNVAYYMSSPIDNLSRNIIKINKDEVNDDTSTLWTTLAHESLPGHLYQHQYYMQNYFQYNIEALLSTVGTTEGWASYSQYLSLKWAGADDDTADAIFYTDMLGLCFSSLTDIGINYYGWDFEDTYDFLSDYYELSADIARDIYNGSVNSPAVYLSYSVGYFKTEDMFNEMREYYSSDKEMYADYMKYSTLPFWLIDIYWKMDAAIPG